MPALDVAEAANCALLLTGDFGLARGYSWACVIWRRDARSWLRDGLGLARREALIALEPAQRTGEPVVRSGRDVEHSSALPADRPSLRRLVRSILGPLLDYDAQHRSALVPSLRCYLENDRSIRANAAKMFVHSNSLGYRLRRVEEICGRRLGRIETQTDFWIALEALRILQISGDAEDGSASQQGVQAA